MIRVLVLLCFMTRILAYLSVEQGKYPFVAHIRMPYVWLENGETKDYFCGGSIIGENVILTAAHCVLIMEHASYKEEYRVVEPSRILLYVGKVDTVEMNENDLRKVKNIIVHEGYISKTKQNDIALIILEDNLEFSSNIGKISLPPGKKQCHDNDIDEQLNKLYGDGCPVTAVGHGVASHHGVSQKLIELNQEIKKDCINVDGHPILKGMMCTGKFPMTQHRAAVGDSGNPLFTENSDGKFVQLGIISWGAVDKRITDTTWDVGTNVSIFVHWIEHNLETMYYDTTLTAKNEPQWVEEALGTLLFKQTHIKPHDPAAFVELTIQTANLANRDYNFVKIHDGGCVSTSKLLAILSAADLYQPKTFTSTSNQGLTVAVTTTDGAMSEMISYSYKQVTHGSDQDTTTCPEGWIACKNRLWCIKSENLCDDRADCSDRSDERELCDQTNLRVKLLNPFGRKHKGLVAVSIDGGEQWGLSCINKRTTSAALLCKHIGYNFGESTAVYYSSTRFDQFKDWEFSVANLDCPHYLSKLARCKYQDYAEYVALYKPCQFEQALVITCYNSTWELNLDIAFSKHEKQSQPEANKHKIDPVRYTYELNVRAMYTGKELPVKSVWIFKRWPGSGKYVEKKITYKNGLVQGNTRLGPHGCMIGVVMVEMSGNILLADKIKGACNSQISKEQIIKELRVLSKFRSHTFGV